MRLLPLRNWTRDEIEGWLSSGAVRWGDELTISQMTALIYDASLGGVPQLIYEALRKHVFNERQ
jgi:hypothetical protein